MLAYPLWESSSPLFESNQSSHHNIFFPRDSNSIFDSLLKLSFQNIPFPVVLVQQSKHFFKIKIFARIPVFEIEAVDSSSHPRQF